jgi:hypothetical protein
VKMFSSSLNRNLTSLQLPADLLQYIHSNEIKLAGLDLPSGLDARTKATINESISRAFVFGFRIEMLICAGLSLASALVAWLMIPASPENLSGRIGK